MKARSMLEGATYDPETLKVVCQALDDARAGIAEMYYYPAEVEHARLHLAKSVLAVAPLLTDAQANKNAALQHFALNHRERSGPAEPL